MDKNDLRKALFLTNDYGVEHQNPLAKLTDEQIAYAEKLWGINTDLSRTCTNCQIRHMLKYDGFVDSEGRKTTKFTVPCKGFSTKLPAGSAEILDGMINQEHIDPKRARLLIESVNDPVAWAELMFGLDDSDPTFHLRSYQKEQMRCSSKRIVIREGRRAGKTFVVCLKLLWYMFHYGIDSGRDESGNKITLGPQIMVVTPFARQLTVVFDELQKLLRRNKDLMGEVKTGNQDCLYVKTPYYHMDFANGGTITGSISGVSSKSDGSAGGAARGSTAQIIYLDEMDMIPDELLDSVIKPLLLSDLMGNAIMIVTSTPIGKRGRFYSYCLEDPDWKEDYLPSTVLPQWESQKKELLKDATPESIQREFMARFIDAAHGVFKPSQIFRSLKDYTYSNCEDPRWWKKRFSVTDASQIVRCIGIDWNDNAGTEFSVVTYIPHVHRYVLTEVINIPGGEFTGQRCGEELIRLNYKWKPNFIYADHGYGHTIIENVIVQSYAMSGKAKTPQDAETVKLRDRIRSYNFSTKVELTNPIDGAVIEKHSKVYLVENAQRQFEDPGPTGDGIIEIPETETELKDALSHYVILRKGTSGIPIYGMDTSKVEDHRLDAFMLAMVGIQLEVGLFSRIRMDTSAPGFIPRETEEQSTALSIIEKVTQGNASIEEWSQLQKMSKEPTRSFARHRATEEDSPLLKHFKNLPSNTGEETIQPRRGNYHGRIHGRRQ